MPTTPDMSSSCRVPLCGPGPYGGWLSASRCITFLCLHLCLPYVGVGKTYSASFVPTKGLLDLTTPGQIRSLLNFSHLPIYFASSYDKLTNDLTILFIVKAFRSWSMGSVLVWRYLSACLTPLVTASSERQHPWILFASHCPLKLLGKGALRQTE